MNFREYLRESTGAFNKDALLSDGKSINSARYRSPNYRLAKKVDSGSVDEFKKAFNGSEFYQLKFGGETLTLAFKDGKEVARFYPSVKAYKKL